jgi:hypothetical protein
MHPNAPFIKRQGEVNAWDNSDFRAAVKATGKQQVIMAGIVTDVRCFCILIYLILMKSPYSVIGLHHVPCVVTSPRRIHRFCQRGCVGDVQCPSSR